MMMIFEHIARRSIALAILLCYAYQLRFFIASHWKSKTPDLSGPLRRYAERVFMFTYGPIAIAALFKEVNWTPVPHTIDTSISAIKREQKAQS